MSENKIEVQGFSSKGIGRSVRLRAGIDVVYKLLNECMHDAKAQAEDDSLALNQFRIFAQAAFVDASKLCSSVELVIRMCDPDSPSIFVAPGESSCSEESCGKHIHKEESPPQKGASPEIETVENLAKETGLNTQILRDYLLLPYSDRRQLWKLLDFEPKETLHSSFEIDLAFVRLVKEFSKWEWFSRAVQHLTDTRRANS